MTSLASDTRTEVAPQVTVIVPVTGVTANLHGNLRSLMHQEYPRYTVIFATQDEHDAAGPVIEKAIAGRTNAQHVIAGHASMCSQKNYNLLQGVQAAASLTDILVFCDAGHYAHPQWLASLVDPLRRSQGVAVSSGYHHVFPEKACICSTGRAICVLALYLLRKIPAFTQPWGGALAIRRIDFERQGIAELWASTVVDDVTLADHLQKKKLQMTIPPDADLQTVVEDRSWRAWESWLIRQWAYLKFVFPRLWLFAGLACIAFTLLVSLASVVVLTGAFREVPAAAAVVVAVAVGAGMLRLHHPAPGSVIFWYPALMAAMLTASWCHIRTWFSASITWAGITYTVAAGGKVVGIQRAGEVQATGRRDGKP